MHTSPRPLPAIESVTPQLDALMRPLIEGQWLSGAVIGLVSGDHELIRGYGHARDNGAVPDENTVFEIGSVSKVFTGLLFADMLERNEVAIDTTMQALLPDGVAAPVRENRPVLLVDLATHLSGLPRLPPSFRPADIANPYADFHEEQLLAAVRSAPLTATPGAHYEYSNFGYGLLGWLLARHAHGSYPQLIADRITTPLGLHDTTIALNESQRARFAQGHDPDGDAAAPWDMDALAGAGAIRSTMHDMLAFVRANISPSGALAPAFVRSHVLRQEIHEPPGYVTLGWHALRDRNTLWHNGETGGFHTYVAFDARQGIGVVVLANTASAQIDAVGLAAMRLLRGQPAPPLSLPPSVIIDDARLERFVGTYTMAPGIALVITHTPGVLRARLANQPAFRIHPASETEFRYRVVDASLTFEIGSDGAVTAVTLHQNGMDRRLPREPH